jgi:serine/threonine-protein kinase
MANDPCATDAELAAFLRGQMVGRPLEWLADHLTACSVCQQRLEQVEDQPDMVVQMIRRSSLATWVERRSAAGDRPVGSPPPRRPPTLPEGELPRRASADARLLYYRRVRLGSLVVAAVLTALLALRLGDADTLTSQDSIKARGLLLFAAVPFYAAGLAVYLWLRPEVSLARLRLLTNTLFALCVLAVGRRQYLYLLSGPPGGFEGPLHAGTYLTGANILSVFSWYIIMVNYGVLIPASWPRVLAVVAAMALASLVIILAAGLANSAVQAQWSQLLSWSALLLSLGVATATFASFQITALRREASEARRLGPYQLKQRLGSGGMGEVYLAEHRLLKRPCAVKLIRPEHAGDPALLRRFEREVRATAELTHPNTVAIYDYGHDEDGTFYYVMEYLPGLNLDDLVQQYGPLPPGRAVHFLRQLCGALHEAHTAGLVHRDIKPGNVIVCRHGGLHDVVKLLDFGLVRTPGWGGTEQTQLTAKGIVLGTPDYMAPEQARGAEKADARSDLYSLGALAYFLLTGRPPFPRETALEALIAHSEEAVAPLTNWRPEIPADLQAVVLRCLEKAASNRFPDAVALEKALAGCACANEWTETQACSWWQAHPLAIRPGMQHGGQAP